MATLQNVIDEIGGNSEMLGTAPLAGECLGQSADLAGTFDGYTVYSLACGDFFLSHDSGSTHFVLAEELIDEDQATRDEVIAVKETTAPAGPSQILADVCGQSRRFNTPEGAEAWVSRVRAEAEEA